MRRPSSITASAGYRTGDSVSICIPLCASRLPTKIIQICGKPGMPVYRLRCQYGTLKRCYGANEVVSCSEVLLSVDASQKPVGLREVARLFNADHELSTMPHTVKGMVDVDLTATSTHLSRDK